MALKVTAQSPSQGYIAWTGANIAYKGVSHTIADGNTNYVYVYWLYSDPTHFYGSNTYPTLGADDILVFVNKNGVPLTVPNTTVIDGSLVVPQSLTANAIAANTITANQLAAGAVTATTVAAGAIGTNALAAGAVIADRIAADVITANHINNLNGLNIGNGNFVVDANGAVTLKGTLNGASGTFNGTLSVNSTDSSGNTTTTTMDYNLTQTYVNKATGITYEVLVQEGGITSTNKDTSGNTLYSSTLYADHIELNHSTDGTSVQLGNSSGKLGITGASSIDTGGVIINRLVHQSIPLVNSWVYFGTGYDNPVYTKSADGFVTLKGMIKGGAVGTVIGTLPAGCRPYSTRLFAVTDGTNTAGRIDVKATGDIVLAAAGSTSYISLSNITFLAEN